MKPFYTQKAARSCKLFPRQVRCCTVSTFMHNICSSPADIWAIFMLFFYKTFQIHQAFLLGMTTKPHHLFLLQDKNLTRCMSSRGEKYTRWSLQIVSDCIDISILATLGVTECVVWCVQCVGISVCVWLGGWKLRHVLLRQSCVMTSVEGKIAGFGEGVGDVKGIIVPHED